MANTKVQSEQIEDGSITADKLADGTIVAAELADNAVTTAKINADAVTGAKIADNAIDSEHYTDGSIDTAHIADSQITVAKMAANSVDSDQYVDGSIDTVHLGDLQVTTAKIANGNISTAKIADNAVTSAKIDTNIDIAGTFDVTGATTLDSTLSVAGTSTLATTAVVGSGSTPFATQRNVNTGGFAMIQGKMGDSASTTAGHVYSALVAGIEDNTNGAEDGYFAVEVSEGGSGSEKLRIKSNGNVGIGTASPDSPLEIQAATNSSSDTTYLKLFNAGENVGHIDFENGNGSLARITGTKTGAGASANDGILTFNTATDASLSERMRIDSSGNVGIGISPSKKLTVFGTGSGEATVQIEGEGGADPYINFLANNTQHWSLGIDDSDSDKFKLSEHSALGTNDYFTVDTSGNVGIGTTSPDTELTIVGGIKVSQSVLTDSITMSVNTSSSYAQTITLDDVGLTFDNNSGSRGYRFGNNGSEKMRIDSSGNLQVGFTSFSSLGTVNTGCRLSNDGETNTLARGSNGTILAFYSGSGGAGYISVTGNAAAYNTSSDYRLKENITPIENGLDRLNNLNPVKFDWKDTGVSSEGFIAHEAQEVFPDAVTGEKDGEDMQGMDYGRITPLLVKAIQEQQEQIEQLKTEIQTLKGE